MSNAATFAKTPQALTRNSNVYTETLGADFKIMCGTDVYICNKWAFVSRSYYFQTACYTEKVLKEQCWKIPARKQTLVRYMMQFLQVNEYAGPKEPDTIQEPPSACRVEFRSSDPAILKVFPAFADGFIISGDQSLKCHAIIIRHEQAPSGDITDGFKMVVTGLIRITPELLPLPIQISILIFINYVCLLRTDVSTDPTFHAKMYEEIAKKYMLDELKPVIVNAFRWGSRALNKAALIAASRDILRPLLTPGMGAEEAAERDWDMANALAQIWTDNWGWLKHEKEVKTFLAEKKMKVLLVTIEKRNAFLIKAWKKILGREEE